MPTNITNSIHSLLENGNQINNTTNNHLNNQNHNSNQKTSNEQSTNCIKPKLIIVIRNGTKPRKFIRMLLNKKTVHSFDQVLNNITAGINLHSGPVKKLFTITGKKVNTLQDYFGEDHIFIAYGPEKHHLDDFTLDSEECKNFNVNRRSSLCKTPQPRKLILAEHSSSSKSSSSSNVSSQDNDLPRKDLAGEIQKRRASLNASSTNKTRTPATQRYSGTYRSSNKNTSVCRQINFTQQLKENNSKLLNNRSPIDSPNIRSNRQLNQTTNTAVNIIKQHRATNLLRNTARNLQASLQNQRRRLEKANNNSRDNLNNNHNDDKIKDTSPSKLTLLLNSANLLNENNDKKEITTKQSNRINSSQRPSAQKQFNNQQSDKNKLNQSNLNSNNKSTNKTTIKQSYPNAASPSLIKPPTAQLIRHDLNSNHLSTNQLNQDIFNYSNKFYDDDHCISETHDLRSTTKNSKTSDQKIYTDQTLSASCNRLSKVSQQNHNNLQSCAAVAAASCSTPSLNNSFNNNQNIPLSVLRNYEIGELIGEGNFAVVHQCTNKRTQRKYALKVIDKRKCAGKEAMIENEVSILRKIRHPNIVQLHEDYDYANELYLVMELVYSGDLFDGIAQVTKYNEKEAQNLIRDLTAAIHYLHSKNICHRDVKPENLLLTSNDLNFIGSDKPGVRLKLADFGLAVEMKDDEPKLYTVCGTMFYISPEQLIANHGYDLKVDIWAAGVIMFIVLSGYAPFSSETNDIDELFDQILSGKIEFNEEYWGDISLEAKDLILNMLNIEIDSRFNAEQVMNHNWIKNDINTFTYEENLNDSPMENDHYSYLRSQNSNLSSLYEEQLNTNNSNYRLNHNETTNYHHHFNNQTNKTKNSNSTQSVNFNQINLDHLHKNENNNDNKLIVNNNSIINNSHILLKNDASDDSNSNTLIDSDVSNSSNSFS